MTPEQLAALKEQLAQMETADVEADDDADMGDAEADEKAAVEE